MFNFSSWFRRPQRSPLSRPAKRRLQLENLEERATPATYDFNATANTLAIDLTQVDESLTVTPSGTQLTFTLSSGNQFTSVGPDSVGENVGSISIQRTDLATSLRIINSAATGSNDVTFVQSVAFATATIEVDLTSAGTSNRIAVDQNFDITATSSLVFKTTANIQVTSFADLTSTGSEFTLEANQQVDATSGSFSGIHVAESSKLTSAGAMALKGRGGDDVAGGQHGIVNMGVITALGATIEGTGGGGAGSNDNDGVRNEGNIFGIGAAPIQILGAHGVGTSSEGFANQEAATVEANDIAIEADVIFLFPIANTISAPTVFIAPLTDARPVQLGGPDDIAGSLTLTNNELRTVTASTLTIGDSDTGSITVTDAISLDSIFGLDLNTDTLATAIFNNSLTLTSIIGAVSINTGAITSPGAAASDIAAATLAVFADSGIGAVGNPLTTTISSFEATTNTGGIFLANTGRTLQIGGVDLDLSGVNVNTAGDVELSNDASIEVDLSQEVVAGPGAITVTAIGATSDILLGGANNSSFGGKGAVDSSGGLVTLTAGQDLLIGDDSSGWGDVAGVGIDLTAARDVVITALSYVIGRSGGDVTVTADSGDVSVIQNFLAGASINTDGGDVTVTAGPGGVVTLDSDTHFLGSGPFTIDTTQSGGNGDITINADRLNLTNEDRISAGTGIVTIQQVSSDWDILLGSNDDDAPNTLELAYSEIGQYVLAGIVRIGDPNNTGDISFEVGIVFEGTDTAHLRTLGSITEDLTDLEGIALVVDNLALTAGQGINDGADGPFQVAVDTLAVQNGGSVVRIENFRALTITRVDTVDGVSNFAADQGLQVATTVGGITVEDTAAAMDVYAAGAGTVNLLSADFITVESMAVVQSDSGTVTLAANFQTSGTGDVTLEANSAVVTDGTVRLIADDNVDGTGGAIVIDATAAIESTAGGPVNTLRLISAPDLTLTSLAATSFFSAKSTAGSLLDDGDDDTSISAASIELYAAERIGGSATITALDVIAQNATFEAAIDVAVLGGTVAAFQTGAGGNVQIRSVFNSISLSSFLHNSIVLNPGDQLAFISSGGELTVDDPETLSAAVDADLLLASTDTYSFTLNANVTNNGPNGDVVLASAANFTLPAGVTVHSENTVEIRVGTDGQGSTTDLSGAIEGAFAAVIGGAGADVIMLALTASPPTTFATQAGNDRLTFGAAGSLTPGSAALGVFDGGGDNNTIDYTNVTGAVAVNLGLTNTGMQATLQNLQESTRAGTIAAGTATVSNYDAVTKTFDLLITVTDLDPDDVTGLHLHRGAVGSDGPVIIDLLPLATRTPAGTGFTFSVTGVSLADSLLGGEANEAAFLGGLTYINIHTAAAPDGLIRGQLFSNGNASSTTGTASGIGQIVNVDNVIGGAGDDSIVGDSLTNILTGNGGADTMVGGGQSDTFAGGAGDDVLVWSNGDGSDTMNGDADNDTVVVNGNVSSGDIFTVVANGTRVDFDRTNLVTFSLDIGSAEKLIVNGVGGGDSFTVADLAGVSNLTQVDLNGFAGDDVFNVNPAANVDVNVVGHDHVAGDTLTIDPTGTIDRSLFATATPAVDALSGSFTTASGESVAFRNIELGLDTTPPAVTSIDDDDADNTVLVGAVVTYTVTFDEPIDAGSVSAADFGNSGSASVTFGTPVLQGDRTFLVPVTATGVGTINFNVASDATITDSIGNAFVGPAVDDEVIQVNPLDGAPPTVTNIDDGDADDLVVAGTTLTYTVTFDEAIDATSVSSADFVNAGTATVTIGTPVPQGDNAFQVPVTPTGPGTVLLRVSGVITDDAGNALVVPVTDADAVSINAPAWRNAANPGPVNIELAGTTQERLVRDLYAKALGRSAAQSEVDAWVAHLNAGFTQQMLVDGFYFSVEHRLLQAQHFYIRFLGRTASAAEAQPWAAALGNGLSEREAAVVFLTSPEYMNNLASETAYITQLYRTVLDRTPGAAEVNAWISTGQGRADVARSLLTSEEFGETVLHNDYTGYLGRQPDPSGESGFLSLFVSRTLSEADIARAILGSQEFVVKAR